MPHIFNNALLIPFVFLSPSHLLLCMSTFQTLIQQTQQEEYL